MSNVNKLQTYRTVLMVSRRKDNTHIENFRPRRHAMLMSIPLQFEDLDNLQGTIFNIQPKFDQFKAEGVNGEVCRLYMSVNQRDVAKANRQLLHHLIERGDDMTPNQVQNKLTSLASQPECAVTKHWLFDFDDADQHSSLDFVKDIEQMTNSEVDWIITNTKNNKAILVNRGFNTQKLLEKWQNVELKRDDMLYLDSQVVGDEQ